MLDIILNVVLWGMGAVGIALSMLMWVYIVQIIRRKE